MEKRLVDIDLRPGQLWCWRFSVGSGGWVLQCVTERGRRQFLVGGYVNIRVGDTFTLISKNDPGPYRVGATTQHWCVILFESKLVWFNREWFEFSELLENTN